jgi:predicted DsbA family dithiol-disulfide isomerase
MDITDWEVLRSIAIEAGVPAKEVDEWKDDIDIGGEQLDFELKRAREMVGTETRGVPVILVQGKYRFDGAPDVSELLETFSSIRNGNDDVHNHTSSNQC